MKSLIQLILAIILLSITTLYANANTYNKLDNIKDVEKFVKDFSVVKLIEDEIEAIEQKKVEEELDEARKKRERFKNLVSRGTNRGIFTATAYDLTVASCGKKQSHPAYGITASGYSLVGQDRESAMTVATDPKVIPLGTKVYIEFLDEEWQHWNGIYTSRDTGSAIKGKKIDIFYKDTGDSKTDQEVWNFGKKKIKVTILPNEDE